jgi:hypothetical protein
MQAEGKTALLARSGRVLTLPPERPPPARRHYTSPNQKRGPETGAPPPDFPVGGSLKMRPCRTTKEFESEQDEN